MTTPTDPAPDPLRGDPSDPVVRHLVDLIRPKNTLPRGPWPTPDQPTEGGAA